MVEVLDPAIFQTTVNQYFKNPIKFNFYQS